jgi:hypothetical protein
MTAFPKFLLLSAAFVAMPVAAQTTPAAPPSDHSTMNDRPIIVYGAFRDRAATPKADPADRNVPALPVIYERTPAPRKAR